MSMRPGSCLTGKIDEPTKLEWAIRVAEAACRKNQRTPAAMGTPWVAAR